MPVLIIDTEGLGAFDENANHDTKIFLLALLLCSLLIFNSVGTIDENALNTLSLVVNLTKSIQFSNKGGEDDIDELAKQFPSFLWVLRDFSLKLEDEFKNPLKPKDYLEKGLAEQRGSSDQTEKKNRIRRLIKHFFQDRECCTLIRPMEEESGLQSLNQIDDSDMRPEFVQQIKDLRSKVFKKVKAKKLNGQCLNGPMVIELAMAYVEALNTGKIPTIENAWDYVCSEENQKALRASTDTVRAEFAKLSKLLPIDSTELLERKDAIHQEAVKIFQENTLSVVSKEDETMFLEKLSAFVADNFKFLEKQNNSVSSDIVKKYFEANFKNLVRQNMLDEKYNRYEDYERDLEHFREKFREEIKGKQFEDCLDEILRKYNDKIFKDISSLKTRRLELELTAYKERMRRAEEELANGKEELVKDKQRLNVRIDELESERVQNLSKVEVLSEKLKFSEKDKEQKVVFWEEKCDKLEKQLDEKDREIRKLQAKLEK